MVIVWDLIYSLSEPDYRISFYKSYDDSSNFAECRYFTKFKWPHISVLRDHMVGYAGSPTCIVYVNVALIPSKVNVKVTGLLNFRQLPKPWRRWAQRPFGAFWFVELYSRLWCVYVCGEKVYAVHVYICGVQDVDVENKASLNVNDYRQPLTQVSRALSH